MKRNETTVDRPAGKCGQGCQGCPCSGLQLVEAEHIHERIAGYHQLYATEAEQYYYYRQFLLEEAYC